jgi:hypothetical protein
MINPNKFANQKIQELGQNLFQGEEFAQQIANKQLDQPVPPPGPYGDINPIMNKESREARRQERKNIRMANKALRSSRRERAKGVKEQGQENYSYDGYEKGRYNKKGDDIEYGKTPRYSKKNPPSATLSGAIAGFSNSALNQDDPKVKKSEAQKLPSKKGKDVKLRPGVKPKEVYSEMVGSIGSPPRLKTPLNQGKKSKYRMVNVQDLEDMGAVKSDKKGKYVVNSDEMKTGTSRDTLRLPRGAKHYTGRDYKVGELIDESDFEDFAEPHHNFKRNLQQYQQYK